VRAADPFIAWCEKERYSYWQGIEELMRREGLLKRLKSKEIDSD
jgi:hypothetical protein